MLNFITQKIGSISFIVALAAIILLIFSVKTCNHYKSEKDIYANNQDALLSKVELYKSQSGKNAAKSKELQLTLDEFKKNFSEQVEVIKDLNLKVKRLENVNTTLTQTIAGGKTNLKDSIRVIYDTLPGGHDTIYTEKIKAFKWKDPWNTITGTIKDKEVECFYKGVDSLTIMAVRVPKKFLFFRWGTKYIEVHAINKNPSTKILSTQTIVIKKK